MKTKHIPNILSCIRILLVPVFVYLFMNGFTKQAAIVFIASGITDVLDGFIARKYGFITNLGKFLDPFADKLTQLCAFICLYLAEFIPLWMPIVYFIKELITSIGALIVFRSKKKIVVSKIYGKLATFFVFAFVCVDILFGDCFSSGMTEIICIFICLYFIFSTAMYIRPNF